MKPDSGRPNLNPSGPTGGRGFEKVMLRLVKGGPERRAIEAGQIDAIIDPEQGKAILLPAAQQAFIERKTRFRGLVDLSCDWYWEQDEHYRFVSRAGPGAERSGFADEDLIGKALWDLSPDSLSEAEWRTHRQQLGWRATYRDLEIKCVDRAGAICYLSISGEPLYDEQDEFKGYSGTARDVTARRRAEAAVREPNRLARAALDALAAQVGVLDSAGNVLFANRGWRDCAAKHRGLGAGVAEGANYLAACDDADGSERVDGTAIAAGIRQVIAGERGLFRYDYACESGSFGARPGGRCWFRLGVTGVEVHGDARARAVVSREDITERKRGELLLELEHSVARCLADADGTRAALHAVIRALCETQGWDCGRYFRLDPAAGVLRCDECWGMPGAAVGEFLENSRGLVLRLDAGLNGRVAQSGQPLWVLGGTREGEVSPTALAPETDATGAFVIPVISQSRTIGVLAFSSRVIHEPDDRMLQAVRSIGSQLGSFLEQQQVVETLRRSRERFRKLTQLACDWYWEQDSDFRYTQYVGNGVLDAGELLGKRSWEIPNLVPDDAAWTVHQAQLVAHWTFCDFEFAVVRPDGRMAYFSISGEPEFDEAGAFIGYCGTGLDITERRRAELAVRDGAQNRPPPAG